jgi:hypothetical protein
VRSCVSLMAGLVRLQPNNSQLAAFTEAQILHCPGSETDPDTKIKYIGEGSIATAIAFLQYTDRAVERYLLSTCLYPYNSPPYSTLGGATPDPGITACEPYGDNLVTQNVPATVQRLPMRVAGVASTTASTSGEFFFTDNPDPVGQSPLANGWKAAFSLLWNSVPGGLPPQTNTDISTTNLPLACPRGT